MYMKLQIEKGAVKYLLILETFEDSFIAIDKLSCENIFNVF